MKTPLRVNILSDDDFEVLDADDNEVVMTEIDAQVAVNAINNYPAACELLRRISESEPDNVDGIHKEIVEFLLHS